MYARTGSLYASLDGIPRLVHRIELFRELSLSDCEEIAMAARERSFTQGTTIFLEDDPVRFVYAVVSGRVRSIRFNRVGKLVILHLTGPGEIVDGLGFAIGSNHSFTANAMTRCQVLTWISECSTPSFDGSTCCSIMLPVF
jgi:CRP-like cAMP-binding protein